MEIESELDTDVRSGGRPDSEFSAGSFRNAGTPFISDDDDHDAMRDDANLLHNDDIAVNVVVRQEGNRHNDGVEMRKPSKFCSVKWIIMYTFFLLVIGFMLLGTGLLYFIPQPDFYNSTCYQLQSDSAIYVNVQLSPIWLYKLTISVEEDFIGTCIQNCTGSKSSTCQHLNISEELELMTVPNVGGFSPWNISTHTCFSFDPKPNIDCYAVTIQYNKRQLRQDILFWPGLAIVLVIIVLFVVSVCHFVWFKMKSKQNNVMFEVNG